MFDYLFFDFSNVREDWNMQYRISNWDCESQFLDNDYKVKNCAQAIFEKWSFCQPERLSEETSKEDAIV